MSACLMFLAVCIGSGVAAADEKDEIAKLKEERLKVAEKSLALAKRMAEIGRIEEYELGPFVERVCEAKLDLATTKAERVKARSELVETLKAAEEHIEERVKAGRMSEFDLLPIKYARLTAELRLAEEKAKKE